MSLLTNWIESLAGEIEISDACLKKITPLSSCNACSQACTTKAIVLKDDAIELNDRICTSCGICIPVCPVQAIKGLSPERKITKDCLILDEGAYPAANEFLYLHKKGMRTIYHSFHSEDLQHRVRFVNKQLEGMGLEPLRITETPHQPSKEKPQKLSRRDFFTKLKTGSRKTVLISLTPAKWRFNEHDFNLTELYPGWSFYEVLIDIEMCTLCSGCFNICPASVFTLDQDRLIINEQKCSGCHLCEDICQTAGILVRDHLQSGSVKMIPVKERLCQHCGGNFHTWEESNKCRVCSSTKIPDFFQ